MPRRSADIGASTCGLYLGGKSVIVVRNYLFSRFLRGQRESTTRNPTSTHPVETGSAPLGFSNARIITFISPTRKEGRRGDTANALKADSSPFGPLNRF